jgi:hypothetical protein
LKTKTENTDMKNIIKSEKRINTKIILGLVIGFTIMFFISQSFYKKPTVDKLMMQAASELNKSCPFMVDNETRLDNSISLVGNIFQYNYTLINREKDKIDIPLVKRLSEPDKINIVKTSPIMKIMRDNKVIVNYHYRDKNGYYLFTISVKPEDYK